MQPRLYIAGKMDYMCPTVPIQLKLEFYPTRASVTNHPSVGIPCMYARDIYYSLLTAKPLTGPLPLRRESAAHISLRFAVFSISFSLHSSKIKMPKKGRKGAKARERAGNPELCDIVGRDKVETLLGAFNSSYVDGTAAVLPLLDVKHARTLQSADMLAEMKIQKSIMDSVDKLVSGEFNDPDKWDYGDDDQSPLKFPKSQNLRTLWGKMNYTYIHYSIYLIPCIHSYIWYQLNDMFQREARTIHLIRMLLTCRNGRRIASAANLTKSRNT